MQEQQLLKQNILSLFPSELEKLRGKLVLLSLLTER